MTVAPDDFAFSNVLPRVEHRPKPREVGLTEVRSAAMGLWQVRNYVDMLGPYLDSMKWTVGTQRLAPADKVREVNAYLAEQQVDASTGGLIESVIPRGEHAVREFLDEARELGFTIVEISTGAVALSLDDKCSIVQATIEAGMKPKPEVTGFSPLAGGTGEGAYVNLDRMVRECEALLEAGAWKLMIEENGIFDGVDADGWNRDLAFGLAYRVPQEYLFWEASASVLCSWLIAEFGQDVNIFTGPELLSYLTSYRGGVFGRLAGRVGAFGR